MNELTETETQKVDWPLWRVTLAEMRKLPNFGFGLTLQTAWFEDRFHEDRDSAAFAFAMLDLRQELESKDGYYLRSQTIQDEETSVRIEVWQIPSAADHEDVARAMESKMRRYANRSMDIRAKTLANPAAELSDAERSKMESSARIAATRLVLLRRERSISSFVEKHAPKLLK